MSIDIESAYRRYGPMVLRRCRRLLRDEASAVDAMHDTFVRLLRSQARLEDRGLSALLWRTATHVSLNHLRARGRRPETADERQLLALAELSEDEERALGRRVLERLFAPEQPSTRVMAVLHFVDGMTYEEVAAEVGLSVSGVRKRLRRVRERAAALDKGATDE